MRYPKVEILKDLTSRPGHARKDLSVKPGQTIAAGAVRDRFGNTNGEAFTAQK